MVDIGDAQDVMAAEMANGAIGLDDLLAQFFPASTLRLRVRAPRPACCEDVAGALGEGRWHLGHPKTAGLAGDVRAAPRRARLLARAAEPADAGDVAGTGGTAGDSKGLFQFGDIFAEDANFRLEFLDQFDLALPRCIARRRSPFLQARTKLNFWVFPGSWSGTKKNGGPSEIALVQFRRECSLANSARNLLARGIIDLTDVSVSGQTAPATARTPRRRNTPAQVLVVSAVAVGCIAARQRLLGTTSRTTSAMIRIRRIPSKFPFFRLYEVELSPHGWPEGTRRHVTRSPNSHLEPILGVSDAWSFVQEADRQWANGKRGWAVEYEEDPQV